MYATTLAYDEVAPSHILKFHFFGDSTTTDQLEFDNMNGLDGIALIRTLWLIMRSECS